ncbi:MAG TPA: SUMF1/EgtB/PvdO family nonheme iron enzyme [Ktedonobacterales bacterium]|jgi:formylglycine-generating enzyme required for sulfatase activity
MSDSDSGPYKIFISYRRDDSQATVDHIYDRLKDHFGRDAIFMDVDSIPPGYSFPGYVKSVLRQCRIALIVIGPSWLSVLSHDGPYKGQPRIADPADFVRVEIEQTLALAPVNDDGRPTSDLLLMPVLVQSARMPHAEELPASLRDLAHRNATPIRRHPDFDHDINRLIAHINSWRATTPTPAAPMPVVTVTTAPAPPQPALTTRPALPPDRFPPRLAELGFRAQKRDGVAFIVPPVCAVPAGEFLMGSDPRRDPGTFDDERPQHRLILAAYSIARFPVTVAEYACFVEAEHHRQPETWANQMLKLDHPVVYVSWDDAVAYAAWLAQTSGRPWRLPTEAQWEKAARGIDGHIYPWGDSVDPSRANTFGGGRAGTTAVGGYPRGASSCGAQDMAGNVLEWTYSLYKPYPYTKSDGREAETSAENRAQRGGSWHFTARSVRAAYRVNYKPDSLTDDLGFRLALSGSA